MLYVTGKGGVGKTTVAAALGLAARRAADDRVRGGRAGSASRARSPARVCGASRRWQLAENLWAITIDPTAALQEWLGRQLGGAASGS